MRVALAQIDTRQGDLDRNAARILDHAERAAASGARVVVFPELTLCGYCPRDLLHRRSFLDAAERSARDLAARLPADLHVVFGSVTRNPRARGKRLLNVALHAFGGRLLDTVPKTLLPNYDVFDEKRYFDSGPNPGPVTLGDRPCGITICEDIWTDAPGDPGMPLYGDDPATDLVAREAAWLVNLSASPYSVGRPELRRDLARRTAMRTGRPLVLVNLVGGNDDILFDGSSCAFDAQGRELGRCASFEEDMVIVDIDAEGRKPDAPVESEIAEMRRALVMGLRAYLGKTGFERVVLGLSGGIDSAVTCALAVEALGAENVRGIAMPSEYSSSISHDDAKELAENLGVRFDNVAIAPAFDALRSMVGGILDEPMKSLTEENIQPRIRGLLLMALSNQTGALLLTTGNKSELAVGYCTLYGDLCGGLAVISDVPKTRVWELARHINDHAGRELIPQRTIERPPSAELKPDQLDTDSLPDYETLDDILERAVENGEGVADIVAAGHDEETVRAVLGRVWHNEYKRRQMAPGLRVTRKAFGSGRRMPITGLPAQLDWSDGEGA